MFCYGKKKLITAFQSLTHFSPVLQVLLKPANQTEQIYS